MEITEQYLTGEILTVAGSVVLSGVDNLRPLGTLPNRSRRASSHVLDVADCCVKQSVLGIRIRILLYEYLVLRL
jgi:hypothetical protein